MSFCMFFFCSFCPPHPKSLVACVQDLLWYGANVPPWSCQESSSVVRRSWEKHHCCPPSVHPLPMSQELHLHPPWSLSELPAGMLCPTLCPACVAWLAGPQTCSVAASVSGYPWAISAPLCSPSSGKVGLDNMLGRTLPCLPCCCHDSWIPVLAGQLTFNPP